MDQDGGADYDALMRNIVTAVAVAAALGLVQPFSSVAAAALLKPGDPFPAWSLRDQTGATVTSQSLIGKTYLLWFYPKAETPGCTAEGRGLRDNFAAFQKHGVEILGVSFDQPAANEAFVKAESFPFRLLSDTDKTLAKQVGAVGSEQQPVASRISYLVGPDGKVRRTFENVTPSTHAGDVLSGL